MKIKATITKIEWRILMDKDSLWARIMRDKYVKGNNSLASQKKEIPLFGKKL